MQRSITSRPSRGLFIFIIVPLSALFVTVLTRQLDVVRVVRWSVLLQESTF